MSFSNPILTGGAISQQPVYQVVTEPLHDVGTRAQAQDGRVFCYSRSTGAAIAAGSMLANANLVAAFTNISVASTAAVGSTSVALTLGSSQSVAADDYAGGYLYANDGDGQGVMYRVDGHALVSSSTAMTVRINEPIRVALTAGAVSEVTLIKNPWADLVVANATGFTGAAGVAPVEIPVATSTPQYFWAQTWGVASVLASGTPAIGGEVILGTAGAITIQGGAGVTNGFGHALSTGVIGEFRAVFLRIAP